MIKKITWKEWALLAVLLILAITVTVLHNCGYAHFVGLFDVIFTWVLLVIAGIYVPIHHLNEE